MGVSQDWATHMIGHEITALHGLTHGHTLAIVLPATLQVLLEAKGDKLVQYGCLLYTSCFCRSTSNRLFAMISDNISFIF